MKITYKNFDRIYQQHKKDIDKALVDSASDTHISGSKLKIFEDRIEKYLGTKLIAVNSGASGLLLGFESFGLTKGDKVIVPTLAPMSVPMMLSKLGCHIIFTDCNLDNFTIDLADLQTKIAPDTKAIIGVDMFGHTCDYHGITKTVKDLWRGKWKIPIIQVAFSSFGGSYKSKLNGTYSDLTIFDFSSEAPLQCLGNAGGITGSQKYTTALRLSRQLGMIPNTEKYDIIGWDARLDSIQANVLNFMLKKVDSYSKERNQIAKRYNEELAMGRKVDTAEWCKHTHNEYPIMIKHRNNIVEKLKDAGIEAKANIQVPGHRQPAYDSKWKLPNSEIVASQLLTLPIWAGMTQDEVSYVIDKFNKIT